MLPAKTNAMEMKKIIAIQFQVKHTSLRATLRAVLGISVG
jgi:hypothetical protein